MENAADIRGNLIENIHEHLKVPARIKDMLDESINDALDELVEGTDTELDDVLKAAIYGPLTARVNELIAEKWDELLTGGSDGGDEGEPVEGAPV